jgi:hypothetical protein
MSMHRTIRSTASMQLVNGMNRLVFGWLSALRYFVNNWVALMRSVNCSMSGPTLVAATKTRGRRTFFLIRAVHPGVAARRKSVGRADRTTGVAARRKSVGRADRTTGVAARRKAAGRANPTKTMTAAISRESLHTLLDRARALREWQIDALADAVQRGTLGVEERILLAASTHTDLRAREDHLLWLVRHAPALDFGTLTLAAMFWRFAEDRRDVVRSAWKAVLDAAPPVPAIGRNAAASLILMEPTFGEAIYHRCQQADPSNPAWVLELAGLYEFLADAHSVDFDVPHVTARPFLGSRADLARLALSNYMSAFVLMGVCDARLDLLWRMRQCAGAAGDVYLSSVLRSMDKVP